MNKIVLVNKVFIQNDMKTVSKVIFVAGLESAI